MTSAEPRRREPCNGQSAGPKVAVVHRRTNVQVGQLYRRRWTGAHDRGRPQLAHNVAHRSGLLEEWLRTEPTGPSTICPIQLGAGPGHPEDHDLAEVLGSAVHANARYQVVHSQAPADGTGPPRPRNRAVPHGLAAEVEDGPPPSSFVSDDDPAAGQHGTGIRIEEPASALAVWLRGASVVEVGPDRIVPSRARSSMIASVEGAHPG